MNTPAWHTRPECSSDQTAVRAINLAAFETSEEADLVDALRADPAWIDGLSMVSANEQGDPVGYALLTRAQIGEVPALCLAPCAVLPVYQRKGAGSAVISAALQAATDRDESFVIVLGHPHYYPRFGFTRASGFGISISADVPDEALMVLSLDGHTPPSGLIRYAAPFGL